ncbi:hypothetical protein Xph01_47530 [Micromonospora phaseoli]|nr:hypothetical protein Xph01_47530 [Micromonospora phaseoli]
MSQSCSDIQAVRSIGYSPKAPKIRKNGAMYRYGEYFRSRRFRRGPRRRREAASGGGGAAGDGGAVVADRLMRNSFPGEARGPSRGCYAVGGPTGGVRVNPERHRMGITQKAP